MKKAGLVGGIGPESTISYYHDIVYGVQNRVGHDFFPNISVESLNLFELLEMMNNGDKEASVEVTLKAIKTLATSGCDFAVLTANTAHLYFDDIQAHSPIPLISIVEATAKEAQKRGYRKVGLLGTGFTMKSDFYKLPFETRNIEIVIPNEEDMAFIHSKIYSELVYEKVLPETQQKMFEIAERLKIESGIEGVVLGCTELPLVFTESTTPLPTLDTVKIHVEAIIEEIMKP